MSEITGREGFAGKIGLLVTDPVLRFWAISLGVVLPLVSALLYPTYHVQMATPAYETTRVLEMPFVLFEIGFFLWAGRRQFELGPAIGRLPRDIVVAGSVLTIVMFASAILVSTNLSYALTHSLLWLVHFAFALAVVHTITRGSGDDLDGFMTWHVAGLILLAFYTAYWFATVPPADQLPFQEIKLRGAVPGWIDVRHFGSWTGAIAAAFAVRILYGANEASLRRDAFCYTLAAGLTVWSGTRAAILAILVVTLIFMVLHRKLPSFSRIALAFVLTAVACAAAYLLLPDHPAFYLFRIEEFGSMEQLTRTRWELWSRTVELWLQSPLIGIGTGAIFWEYAPDYFPTQPHNVILQFLYSWGVIGAAAGLWILFRAIRAVHRAGRDNPASYALMAMLYGLLFQSLLEGMLHYPRFIVSIIVLGAIVWRAGQGPAAGDSPAKS